MDLLFDEKTRIHTISLLEKKSDTAPAFKNFKLYFEKANNCSIKAFKSDQGGDYIGSNSKYLKKQGINL